MRHVLRSDKDIESLDDKREAAISSSSMYAMYVFHIVPIAFSSIIECCHFCFSIITFADCVLLCLAFARPILGLRNSVYSALSRNLLGLLGGTTSPITAIISD